MDSGSASLSVESTAATRKISRRRRPLHTCGVSLSAIAHKTYKNAQDFNGPIGSITKRMTTLATPTFPLVHALQYQWLALLSFADDNILVVENTIEKLFPQSTRLFDKIDQFVHAAETLPGRFDDVVNNFPTIIHRVPILDWALTCMISWLKFLISILAHWGSKDIKEREITVDMHCPVEKVENSPTNVYSQDETQTDCQEQCPEESTKGTSSENVKGSSPRFDSLGNDMKCSYKEILEKGKNEDSEKKEDSLEDSPEVITIEREAENECIRNEDPILELFDASWHMSPGKGGELGSLTHSVS